jgi:hypothetical protein
MVLLPWLAKGKIAKPLLHRNKSLASRPVGEKPLVQLGLTIHSRANLSLGAGQVFTPMPVASLT